MSRDSGFYPFDDEQSEDSLLAAVEEPEWEPDLDSPDIWDQYEPDDLGDDGPEVVAGVAAGADANSAVDDRVVVLTGPRSGRLVSGNSVTGAAHVTAVRAVPSAADALAPGSILMIVHRPGRYAARMPGAMAQVHSDFAHTGLALGISAGLPRKGSADTATYLDSCGVAAIRIADPEGYALPSDLIADPVLTVRQQGNVNYAHNAPAAGTPSTSDWNRQVVRAQRNAGANVLLTPGRSLDPANATSELLDANRALDDLLEEVGTTEIPAWNLSLPATWLMEPALRDSLLAELVERDDVLVWNIRVRWPLIKKTYGQTLSAQLLQGYRELAETAQQEERTLLLPATGLTGWMSIGWGTTGFGTGSASSCQSWADRPRIASRAGVSRATVHRHYVNPLLHTITVDSHNNLTRTLGAADYPVCNCTYCGTLASALTWQPEIAAAHSIYAMGRLSADVSARARNARPAYIAGLIRRARMLRDDLPTGSQLDPKESPEHLSVWDTMLP